MLKRKPAGGSKGRAAQFGRYRVLSPLGEGAMATVYLAEDPSLNRLVAIKVIHSHLASIGNLLTRFTAEAKTAASLRNPNIVEIFDYGLQDGQQYLVMEYIDGPNLQFILNLREGRPMEPETCAAVICQAAEGLISAEKNKVVHRDIKPENMMFTSEGALKIADFGIAHINEQNLTQTGSLLGSPSFMAPEQIEGGAPTPQTDMFALGAVFYYCLTGRKPFAGSNIPALMRNICDLPHPPVLEISPEADPALAALVDNLLQKKPEDRGQGARWLAGQLRAYLNGKGVLDLAEKCRGLLSESAARAGDRTLVESPRTSAPATGSHPSAAASEPPGFSPESGQGVGKAWKAWKALSGLQFSPPVMAAAGVGALSLITLGIWLSVWAGKAPEDPGPATQQEKPAPPPAKPVPPALASLALDPPQIELAPGTTRILRVLAQPPEARFEASWRSSDTSVARVEGGEVRGMKPGKARVEAFTDSPPLAGLCEVIVVGTQPAAATPATPPVAEGAVKARIFISSAPPFAEVFLDNKFLGNTPLKKDGLPTGRHRLQVTHRSFRGVDTAVNLRPGENRIKFRLFER